MSIDFNPAISCNFGAITASDSQQVDAKVNTGDFVPLWLFQGDRAFDINIMGGNEVTFLNANVPAAPPIAMEWKLYGGVIAGACKLFDDQECAATVTVLKGATQKEAGARSGVLFNVEGGEFNGYLLCGRLVTGGPALEARVTLAVLRAPSTGSGMSVRVGGFSG